jgi:membrane protease YdiL (CAAX protease family)
LTADGPDAEGPDGNPPPDDTSVVTTDHEPAPPTPEPVSTPRARPGTSTFTIEGRAAPALFVIGWLASLLGLGIVFIGAMATSSIAPIVLVAGLVVLSVGLVAGAGSQGIERRAKGVLPYQGPSPLLVFVTAVPVSLVALILISLPFTWLGFTVSAESPAVQLGSVVVQTLIYVGLIRLLVVDTGALSWLEMGLTRLDRRAVGEMLGGSLWAIPVIVVTAPISIVLVQALGVTPTSPLPPTGETSGFLLQFIAGAIVAPFGEELLFRGLATTAWVRALGPMQGVLRAALLFAIAHILNVSAGTAGEASGLALIGFATRLPIAIALGWLFVRRGSLWAPIGLHMAFNGILLIVGEIAIRSV